MSLREFAVLFLVCLIWGLHFIVMKMTVGEAAGAGLGYGALNYAFMFPALGLTTASAAAITIELYVPFSIILSVLVFKDKIGAYKILGILLAFIGVIIITSAKPDESAGPYFLWGILLMVGAAMSEAIGAVLVKLVKGVNLCLRTGLFGLTRLYRRPWVLLLATPAATHIYRLQHWPHDDYYRCHRQYHNIRRSLDLRAFTRRSHHLERYRAHPDA